MSITEYMRKWYREATKEAEAQEAEEVPEVKETTISSSSSLYTHHFPRNNINKIIIQ